MHAGYRVNSRGFYVKVTLATVMTLGFEVRLIAIFHLRGDTQLAVSQDL